MGKVYLAFDPMIERQVALKVIHPHLLGTEQGKEILERFRSEAKAAGRLSHPNIVGVYEYGEDPSGHFIAMEYVEGRSLKESLAEGRRFALEEIVRLMGQLLDGLDYAHRNGVVHRDIKPANIMMLADDTIKITDFGIAHLDDSQLTRTGVMMGSPAYMAPEQCLGHRVDGRADIFSSAVVLYELLTGERPFSGQQSTTIVQRILSTEPDPPSRLNPLLPETLDRVVLKALAKQPAERYPDASSFCEALEQAVAKSERRSLVRGWKLFATLLVLLALGGVGYLYVCCREQLFAQSGIGVGIVEVRSEPAEALVLLDGSRFLGVTPAKLTLPVGNHRLIVKKYGYRPLEVVVDVQSEDTVPVEVVLMEND